MDVVSVSTEAPTSVPTASTFTLTSPDLPADGRLPVEYTCDGDGSTLPLAWSGAPEGTQGYAVIMSHEAPDGIHWYWVLYNIPADVTNLPKNVTGIGTLGNNINNGLVEYSPPCSKGPGDKTYTYTVYALSAEPQISVPAEQVDRDTLLAEMEGITLASVEMNVVYAREGMADPNTQGNQQGGGQGQGNNQPTDGASAYNIEQATSDKAQGMTISYDALAFMTGDLGSDSFFPPGKVADFWGFQYLRDNDPSEMGHAGDFLTSAAMNTLNNLTADQRAQLVALAESQVNDINNYGYKRFILMDAFRRLANGDLPTVSTRWADQF
jgi:Raf kinase inhibitor-like YbhB/YbcL family protein